MSNQLFSFYRAVYEGISQQTEYSEGYHPLLAVFKTQIFMFSTKLYSLDFSSRYWREEFINAFIRRPGMSMTATSHGLVFFGGNLNESATNIMHIYDGNTLRSFIVDVPSRSFHAATFDESSNALIIHGGTRDGVILSDMYEIDLETGESKEIQIDYPLMLMNHSITIIKPRLIYAYGGFIKQSLPNTHLYIIDLNQRQVKEQKVEESFTLCINPYAFEWHGQLIVSGFNTEGLHRGPFLFCPFLDLWTRIEQADYAIPEGYNLRLFKADFMDTTLFQFAHPPGPGLVASFIDFLIDADLSSDYYDVFKGGLAKDIQKATETRSKLTKQLAEVYNTTFHDNIDITRLESIRNQSSSTRQFLMTMRDKNMKLDKLSRTLVTTKEARHKDLFQRLEVIEQRLASLETSNSALEEEADALGLKLNIILSQLSRYVSDDGLIPQFDEKLYNESVELSKSMASKLKEERESIEEIEERIQKMSVMKDVSYIEGCKQYDTLYERVQSAKRNLIQTYNSYIHLFGQFFDKRIILYRNTNETDTTRHLADLMDQCNSMKSYLSYFKQKSKEALTKIKQNSVSMTESNQVTKAAHEIKALIKEFNALIDESKRMTDSDTYDFDTPGKLYFKQEWDDFLRSAENEMTSLLSVPT